MFLLNFEKAKHKDKTKRSLIDNRKFVHKFQFVAPIDEWTSTDVEESTAMEHGPTLVQHHESNRMNKIDYDRTSPCSLPIFKLWILEISFQNQFLIWENVFFSTKIFKRISRTKQNNQWLISYPGNRLQKIFETSFEILFNEFDG